MGNIEKLLNEVGIIHRKNAEILDATGARFNMFKVCGVNHYENTHSAILAEFLNPQGSHGLKHHFLQTFLEVLGVKIPFNVEKARVKTEHSTSEGRIDIFIEDDKKNVIIIENKIDAGDQWEQLKRYDNFAKSYAQNYQIFYLTLFGSEASEQSGKGVDYTPISHAKNIIEWLEKCLSLTTRYPIVRETIVQYINHLKTLTNQDMDTKNQEEVTTILAEDLVAAQVICRNYKATFDVLAKKYFNPKMEEFAKEKGLKYHYEESLDTHLSFKLEKPGKFSINFGKNTNGYFYELKYDDVKKYSFLAEKIKKLNDNLKNTEVIKKNQEKFKEQKPKKKYIFKVYIKELTIENWQEDIIKNDNFFDDCKGKIEEILKVMKEIGLD